MKVFFRTFQDFKNVIYELWANFSRISVKVDYDVPYVCQFSVPEQAELILKKKQVLLSDPDWKKTGATSSEHYAQWASTICGMACTAMILSYFKNKTTKLIELAEDALKNKVYIKNLDNISGMRYKEFAQWIQAYGLSAKVYTVLSLKGIQYALFREKLVIVSVNPNIRGYNTAPQDQKGGHLVLVTGYNLDKNTISINNPSGFLSLNTQIKHVLPTTEFMKYYANRGIIISNNN